MLGAKLVLAKSGADATGKVVLESGTGANRSLVVGAESCVFLKGWCLVLILLLL